MKEVAVAVATIVRRVGLAGTFALALLGLQWAYLHESAQVQREILTVLKERLPQKGGHEHAKVK